MLPFLKNIKSPGVANTIIKNRAPDEAKASEDSDKSEPSIKEHVKSLMSAIKTDNHDQAESCLRSIFKALDKEPHEEGEHKEPPPHSYEAQNEEAAD